MKLENLIIPEGEKEIGARAYHDNTSVFKVIIPDSVTQIGESAFEGCTNLSMIEIPDSVTDIGEYAFKHCRSFLLRDGDWSIEADIPALNDIDPTEDHDYDDDGNEYMSSEYKSYTALIDFILAGTATEREDAIRAMDDYDHTYIPASVYLAVTTGSDYAKEAIECADTAVYEYLIDKGDLASFCKVLDLGILADNDDIDSVIDYAQKKNQHRFTEAVIEYRDSRKND